MNNGLKTGQDGKARCFWCGDDPLYVRYHDEEWGRPVTRDISLYEKICLEGFQAGLSWLTILRKRENFRAAFAGFDFEKVARFTEADVARLMQDPGIIRHEKKTRSAINNARKTIDLIDEHGSLYEYFQLFRPAPSARPERIDYTTYLDMTWTDESKRLAGDLKQRGFTFLGPTTIYAHMQATGLVNDHIEGCAFRKSCEV